MNRAHPNTLRNTLTDHAAQGAGVGPSIDLNRAKLNNSANDAPLALDQLELFELEPRVFYSASPIPVDSIDAGSTPDSTVFTNAMDVEAALTAPPTASGSAVVVPVAQTLATGSIVTVDTTADIADGDVSSIDALLANRGADGQISLREAIRATNNTPNVGGPDLIRFAISESDPGRLYYRDDGISGSLSLVATPSVSDSLITDFDPDYISAPHSWFRIGLTSTLDAITDAAIIDGYSQSGASENTLEIGNDAILRVEITNVAGPPGLGPPGLFVPPGLFNLFNDGLILNQNSDGSVIQGLVVSGFGNNGIVVQQNADDITIRGNFIGTDVTGTQANANRGSGIFFDGSNGTIGGPDPSDRNIISGNIGDGIGFSGVGSLLENNYIGVDATGLNPLGNGNSGVNLLVADDIDLIDNVISGNDSDGIRTAAIDTAGRSTIAGNKIGVGADGVTPLGNQGAGIRISSLSSDSIQIGGSDPSQANIIGDNQLFGILLDGSTISSTIILNNFIGTDASGTLNLGNGLDGILFLGGTNSIQIGSGNPNEGNVITNNGGAGVAGFSAGTLGASNSNTILGNQIFDNNGLAINLSDGIIPTVTDASFANGSLSVDIEFTGRANTEYKIEVYSHSSATPSGSGEAEMFIGSVDVITDSNGVAIFQFSTAIATVEQFVAVTATEAFEGTSELSLSRRVTLAPTVNNRELTLNEGAVVTLTSSNLSTTDLDRNAVFSVENVVGGFFALQLAPTVAITSFTQGQIIDGLVVFVDDGNETSPSFDVVITNSGSTIGPLAALINFTNVNDAPQATDFSVIAMENTPFQIDLSALSSDVDSANSAISFTFDTPVNGTITQIANPSGLNSFTFTPNANFNGVEVINFTVSDGFLTDQAQLTINVEAVNEAPVAIDGIVNSREDTPFQIDLSGLLSDEDSASSEISITFDTPANGTITQIANPSGLNSFIFIPNENFNGIEVINFTVSDGFLTDQAQLTINVEAVNDAPVAIDGIENSREDTPFQIDLSALLSDVDSANSEISITFDTPANGTITQIANPSGLNSFTFIPNENFNGVEVINFTVSDGFLTDQAQFTINIESVNDAPTVVDNRTRNTFIGTSVTGNALDGAFDIDNDPLTFVFGNQSGSGTFNAKTNGDFEFIPDSQSGGTTTIEFNAFDGAELSNSGTLTFVVPPPPPPVQPPNVPTVNDESEDESDAPIIVATNVPEPIKPTEIVLAKPELINFASQAPDVNNDDSNAETTSTGLLFPEFSYHFRPTQANDLVDEQTITNIDTAKDTQEKRVPLFTALDNLSDELDSISNNFAISNLAARVTLSGVSIGLVSWILHGGALAASMLANLPAWRMIDPIAVLGYQDEENDANEANGENEANAKDDESLLDIVDNPEVTEVSTR